VSIGYCVGTAGGVDLERLVATADAQLYEAKRAGRGCYRGTELAA
jgi:GGDEF domain-containing protein